MTEANAAGGCGGWAWDPREEFFERRLRRGGSGPHEYGQRGSQRDEGTHNTGVIYPALTYLEESGEALSVAEGARKLFRLTDLGQEHLQSQREQVDAILARLAESGKNMDRMREAFARGAEGDEFAFLRELWASAPELVDGLRQIREAIAARRRQGRPNWSQLAEILRHAASEIHPAEDASETGSNLRAHRYSIDRRNAPYGRA